MKHVKFGGSTAARTMGCAAWLRMSDEMPTATASGSNPAAEEGTLLHECMELIVRDDAIPITLLGDTYKSATLTKELYDSKLMPALEVLTTVKGVYDLTLTVEPFVQISDDMAGSIDVLGISADKKTVVVLDYKFGYHSVHPENNAQLNFYTLAAATDSKTAHMFDEVERIVFAIVQPNDDGDVLKTWVQTMDGIDAFETEYFDAVEAAEDPDSQPTSGAWCTYCPAQAICPVKTGKAMQATRFSEINAAKLAEYLPLADEVEAWAKAVKKLAHEQLELGTPIENYKLVAKRSSRKWGDEKAVETLVRKAKKIKLDDAFDTKLKSVAQLEKACDKLGVDFYKKFGHHVHSVSSGTTLAKAEDKRPAVIPVAGLSQLNALLD